VRIVSKTGIAFIVCIVALNAAASPGSGEQVKWQVLGGGGGRGVSAGYALSGTAGQTAVGLSVSANYAINSGFWQDFSGSAGCCAGRTGNIDCDALGDVDIADLSRLIDYQYISFLPLCCVGAANIDGDLGGEIDIADLSRLIDYLYISFAPTAPCQ
jgi:hypothetical protein